MGEFTGKVAIVTGASRGIGRAIVSMLGREGCHVSFNYLNSEGPAAELATAVSGPGIKCLARRVDIRDFDAVRDWIEEVKEELGRVDFLVNNAGIIADKALMLMGREDWLSVIDTNLNGMFNATRACIVTFMKQKSGSIVNISSVSGVTGLPRQTNYSASKGGMNAFTKSLAKEVAAFGVRVNAVAPGFIETDILSGFNEKQRGRIVEDIPLGRIGRTDEVASCVRFLLSEASAYITGQIMQIDGGLAIR